MKNIMLLCVTALVILLTTTGGLAQSLPGYCYHYPDTTTGPTPLRIAVAANFEGPAKEMVRDFLASNVSYPTTYTVWICPNSTGVLFAEIVLHPTVFDMFFAANEAASDIPIVGESAFTYAKGIPIIFGYKPGGAGIVNPVNNANALIHGLSPATEFATLPYGNLSGYSINTATANDVAIADPSVAPYGQAALSIMTALGSPSPYPVTIATLNTVTEVQNNVGKNIPIGEPTEFSIRSGFASKAQFCASDYINPSDGVPDGIAYVAFTNATYMLTQRAVKLTNNAGNLESYILGRIKTGTWNTFLTSNCYGAL